MSLPSVSAMSADAPGDAPVAVTGAISKHERNPPSDEGMLSILASSSAFSFINVSTIRLQLIRRSGFGSQDIFAST